MMKITLNKDRRIITINPSMMTHLVEKFSMLKSKTCKPAVVMKRCEETRSVIVKTENDKIFRRNRQHLCQRADSNGTDDTIVISDGEEENSKEQEVIVKLEELEMDLSNEANLPHDLLNEVTTQSRRVSRRMICYMQ